MSNYFCPFIKDECTYECIFYDDEPKNLGKDKCTLYKAASEISNFNFHETTLSDYLDTFEEKLSFK